MAHGIEDRQPGAGRGAADIHRRSAELPAELMEIVGPRVMLRAGTVEGDVRRPAVAAVVQQHPIAAGRDGLGEAGQFAIGAPASRRQGHEGPPIIS